VSGEGPETGAQQLTLCLGCVVVWQIASPGVEHVTAAGRPRCPRLGAL